MITVFTPSFADEANTNAQNLTVKEVVGRLSPERFRVIMLGDGFPDSRIRDRANTTILPTTRRGNTARWLTTALLSKVDVYFFPREGPLDSLFMHLRRRLRLPTALVTYVVMALDEIPVGPRLEQAIREGDCVIGNSEYVSQTIQERFGVEAETIYDGVNRELFHPAKEVRERGERVIVLYAGSFQSRKRVDLVIQEAAKWPAVEFRLAGRGEEEENYRSQISRLNCGNVIFLGHLTQKELAQEMQKVDVFLFPSVLEGHPQVLGQATSSGLPVVAMERYRPDFVVNGETGYLVKSENELSEKLRQLLSDPELRTKMSAAAVRHAIQFDWDKVTQDWEKVFAEATSRRKRH
jgi:glycosyltransferase involved in cell wall biosynthesis